MSETITGVSGEPLRAAVLRLDCKGQGQTRDAHLEAATPTQARGDAT